MLTGITAQELGFKLKWPRRESTEWGGKVAAMNLHYPFHLTPSILAIPMRVKSAALLMALLFQFLLAMIPFIMERVHISRTRLVVEEDTEPVPLRFLHHSCHPVRRTWCR